MMSVCTCNKAYDCIVELREYSDGKEMDQFSMTYEVWQQAAETNSLPKMYNHLGGSFMDYSQAVIFEARRRARGQSEVVQDFEDGIIALLSIAALLCTMVASHYWVDIRR